MITDIFKILLIAICTLLILNVLKYTKSPVTKLFSMVVCLAMLIYALSLASPITELIQKIFSKTEVSDSYLKIILKCIGICILGDFTSKLCTDSGESTLAYSCDFICKVSIITVALPLYTDIFNMIIKLWEK